MTTAELAAGQLVRVRGQQSVVSDLSTAALPSDELAAATLPGRTLITLTSVSEDDLGEESADAGSYEADLEFLSRVAEKVAREREDLGRVNPVLLRAGVARRNTLRSRA